MSFRKQFSPGTNDPLTLLAEKIPMRIFGPPLNDYSLPVNKTAPMTVIFEMQGELTDVTPLLRALKEREIISGTTFNEDTSNLILTAGGHAQDMLMIITAIKAAGREYVEIPAEKKSEEAIIRFIKKTMRDRPLDGSSMIKE